MFNLSKTALFAAVCCVAFGATAQAQLSLSSSLTLTYEPATPTFQFDEATGVLTITGTSLADTCVVKTSYSYMVVELTNAGSKKSQAFIPTAVKEIVFNGGDGDDVFEFENLALMAFFNKYYGLYDVVCDLRGEGGCDYLSGGINDDILCGGLDGENDILVGNDGADIFVHSRTYQTYTYFDKYTWSTKTIKYNYVSEYCFIADYDGSEGDINLFEDQLDAYLDFQSSSSSESSTSLTSSTLTLN